MQEKKNVATKTEKREISYFSAKKSPSKTRKLRVECKTNTPDPVDQNELHRLNSHYFHVSAHQRSIDKFKIQRQTDRDKLKSRGYNYS